MAEDRKIIHEITPLMGKDVLYIADRHKTERLFMRLHR